MRSREVLMAWPGVTRGLPTSTSKSRITRASMIRCVKRISEGQFLIRCKSCLRLLMKRSKTCRRLYSPLNRLITIIEGAFEAILRIVILISVVENRLELPQRTRSMTSISKWQKLALPCQMTTFLFLRVEWHAKNESSFKHSFTSWTGLLSAITSQGLKSLTLNPRRLALVVALVRNWWQAIPTRDH